MAAPQNKPEVKAAVLKGALVEGVLIAIGAAIYLGAGQIGWLIGAVAVGAVVMLFLMAQSGAFGRS